MPIATPDQYAEMLDKAKAGGFAYPAFNVSSSQTINAVLQGLTEAGSDGIIQVTTGGADYFAGQTVKNRAAGALAFAKFATEVAKNYPITVALHTDHCPKDALDGFVLPLIAASEEEVKAGRNPIFQSHMWDGSAVPLDENLEIAQDMIKRTKAINAILEVEIGVVGGEEDGVSHEHQRAPLHDARRRRSKAVEALGLGENGRYMAALTFGNVHGVYKPGNVKLRPELLKEIQDGLAAKYGTGPKPLDLVFHGGSGSTDAEIAEAVAQRRREDEHRHRHAVRVHPLDRRLHVQELRRRPQGRRRGRQQEGLRPARLGQGRRDRPWPPASSRPPSSSARPATPASRRTGGGCVDAPPPAHRISTSEEAPAMAEQEPQPDDRPRPQFGELAPPGWVWHPPADADRLDTSRPLEREDRCRRASRRRPADRDAARPHQGARPHRRRRRTAGATAASPHRPGT